MDRLGIIAALATAVSWAACAIFFTSATRRIGVLSTNCWRVLLGTLLLFAAHLIAFKRALPAADAHQWLILSISGIVGLVIGDTFLFQCYLDIGPRLGILIFSTNPVLTALIAWPALGEKLRPLAWLGMAITLAGTLWVVAEENSKGEKQGRHHVLRGVLFAALAAAGQAAGYVIAKPAMEGAHGVDPLGATLIRVGVAIAGFWLIALARGALPGVLRCARDGRSMLLLAGGAITGPALGIWLSLVALARIPAGIAATLTSTLPIVILPMVIFVYRERVSWRAAIGAVVAIAGIAILINA